MFVLTLIGWLLFRETELSAIVRDLTLSPFAAPAPRIAAPGCICSCWRSLYSIPLWVQSIWVEWHRDATGVRQPAPVVPRGWPRAVAPGRRVRRRRSRRSCVLRSRASLDFIYFQF